MGTRVNICFHLFGNNGTIRHAGTKRNTSILYTMSSNNIYIQNKNLISMWQRILVNAYKFSYAIDSFYFIDYLGTKVNIEVINIHPSGPAWLIQASSFQFLDKKAPRQVNFGILVKISARKKNLSNLSQNSEFWSDKFGLRFGHFQSGLATFFRKSDPIITTSII